MPTLTVIAGPNGSGKSTITASTPIEGRERLLDPDAIARRMNPASPVAAAIAAGREVLTRTEEYLEQRASFAVETTLSSRSTLGLFQRAREAGYTTVLIFVALDSPDRCITRVRNRSASGGHSVPDADVRRRYDRSMSNLVDALPLVDYARLFDNSAGVVRPVLIARAGVVVWRATPPPNWLPL